MNMYDLNPSRTRFAHPTELLDQDTGERTGRPQAIRRRMWPFAVSATCAAQSSSKAEKPFLPVDTVETLTDDCAPATRNFVS